MARLVYYTSLGYHDSWFAAFLCLTIFNCSPPKLVRILESESRSWTVTSSDQTTTSVFRINRGHSTLHLYGPLIATRRARQTIYVPSKVARAASLWQARRSEDRR